MPLNLDTDFTPVPTNAGNPEAAVNENFAKAKTALDLLEAAADEGGGASYPPGGDTGQVLAKASADDNDVAWVDPPEGGSGGGSGGAGKSEIFAQFNHNWPDAPSVSAFVSKGIAFRATEKISVSKLRFLIDTPAGAKYKAMIVRYSGTTINQILYDSTVQPPRTAKTRTWERFDLPDPVILAEGFDYAFLCVVVSGAALVTSYATNNDFNFANVPTDLMKYARTVAAPVLNGAIDVAIAPYAASMYCYLGDPPVVETDVTVRRFRLYMQGITGGFSYSMSEFNFLSAAGVPFSRTGITISAAGFSFGQAPENVLDGSTTTWWEHAPDGNTANQSTPSFLEFVLPTPLNVRKISITSRGDSGAAGAVATAGKQVSANTRLQYATDADPTTWIDHAGPFNSTDFGLAETRTFDIPQLP